MSAGRARLVGLNHIALEVDDIEEALAFYGQLIDFELRGRSGSQMAFIDAGDQFIALSAPRRQPPDDGRHFGLVVDDREAVRQALAAAGVDAGSGRSLRFRDPWGNQVEVVQYDQIQFSKRDEVLRGMGLGQLGKSTSAQKELRAKFGD